MFLDYGIFANNIKSPDVYQALVLIQNAVNNIDDTNVLSGGLTGEAFRIGSIPLSRLLWREFPITLFKSMPAVTTTTNLSGGYFNFDPTKFPAGQWYLEAVMQITAGGTATLNLMNGPDIIIGVNTTQATFELVRSIPIAAMPMSNTVLTAKLVSSGSSYTAAALGASLIYVPAT